MTTALSSSQKCDVCRNSGSNCCGHDCTYRLITCMPHVSSHDHDHINPAAAPFLSPTSSRNPPPPEASHEFHFFGNDDNTITWLLGDINSSRRSRHDDEAAAPVVLAPPPTVNYSTHHQHRPHNYCNPWRLTLDIYSSTASSTGSPSRSTPSVDVSVIGQAASSALPMSFSGSTLTDASTGNFKDVGNAMNISGGMNNQLTEREARVLRYKEKKKNRMFDKQIRYPSRKAYARQRPRIRGRFAKRPEAAEPTTPS